MHLLTVSGFLGAGKTTVIIGLVEATLKRGLKPAILVNEIGDIGIDNLHMQQLDLNVYQLLGGCICCTLAAELPETMEKLVTEYTPDIVIIEPSGAAKLNQIQGALENYHGPSFDTERSLVVLDALRLEFLIEAMTPLIKSQVTTSDVILLNKSDAANEDQIKNCREIAKRISQGQPIFHLSAKQGISDEVMDEILPTNIERLTQEVLL